MLYNKLYNYYYSTTKYLHEIIKFSWDDIINLLSSSYIKSITALSTSLYFLITQGGYVSNAKIKTSPS